MPRLQAPRATSALRMDWLSASIQLLTLAGCIVTLSVECLAAWGLSEIVQFLINPVAWIESAFAGTQREQVTEYRGALLAKYGSDPWVKGLGLSIYRVAKSYGAVLSAQKDNVRWFAPMVRGAAQHMHLTAQGELLLTRFLYLGQPLPARFPIGYQTKPSDPPPPVAPPRKPPVCGAGEHLVGQNCRPCDYSPTVNPCPPPPPPVCPPGFHLVNGHCEILPRIRKTAPAACACNPPGART